MAREREKPGSLSVSSAISKKVARMKRHAADAHSRVHFSGKHGRNGGGVFTAELCMRRAKPPLGSRIRCDTHAAVTRRKMLLGACSACLARCVRVRPRASPSPPGPLRRHVTSHKRSPSEPSRHQSDTLPELQPFTSNPTTAAAGESPRPTGFPQSSTRR